MSLDVSVISDKVHIEVTSKVSDIDFMYFVQYSKPRNWNKNWN